MITVSYQIDSKELTAAIGRFGGDGLTKALKPRVETRANEARRLAVQTFISRGVGRGIFGEGRESGAWKIITLDPVTTDGGAVVARLHAKGFAALQELGGRTKKHVIKPKSAEVLAFADTAGFGFGGDFVFAEKVNHPGGRVDRYPALVPAAEKAQALLLEDARGIVASLWGGQGKAA